MLDGYVSEKEQIESIRKWWQAHGKSLLMAVAIGLLIGLSWRYFQKLSLARAENGALVYQQVLQAANNHDAKTLEGGVVILKSHYAHTPYASLGALLAAKQAVSDNQLPIALAQLTWVIDHGNNARLQTLARINAARVLLAQHHPAEALKLIQKIKDKNFMPLVAWVQGDIALQQGDRVAAQKQYQEAKNGLTDLPEAQNVLTIMSS